MLYFGERFCARFVDGLIFCLISLVGYFTLANGKYLTIDQWDNLSYLLFLIYNITMTFFLGQTIGKKLLKIKVISTCNNHLNLLCVVIREIIVFCVLYTSKVITVIIQLINSNFAASIIPHIIGIILPIIYILIGYEKLFFHDMLAKTKVISAN